MVSSKITTLTHYSVHYNKIRIIKVNFIWQILIHFDKFKIPTKKNESDVEKYNNFHKNKCGKMGKTG